MTNQIAIQVHTRPGDEVICDKLSHIYNYEGGGIARNSGASVRLMHGDRGRYDLEEMIANINPADSHYARTSLVAVEDTCNKGGGAVWNVDELTRLSEASRTRGLGFHLDGARVWNAWVQRGEWGDASALQNYGRLFDSMSLCLSKGLGCPVGSVLVGSESFIAEAHRSRKVMGGGMRQAGVLAAAGLYALDHHVTRLEQDHRHARMLEQTLGASMRWTPTLSFSRSPKPPQTGLFKRSRTWASRALTLAPTKSGSSPTSMWPRPRWKKPVSASPSGAPEGYCLTKRMVSKPGAIDKKYTPGGTSTWVRQLIP